MSPPPDRPGRYFHAWMMARCWDLLAELRKNGIGPDGPVTTYATDDRFTVSFTVNFSRPGELITPPISAPSTSPQAGPIVSDSVIASLGTLEKLVLSQCVREKQTAKAIARKCQRSLNRVREAIASLIAKGLLERAANWTVRLKSG